MLQISVQPRRGRSVLSRRAFLRTSLASTGAFALPDLLRLQAAAGRPRRDTAVIQLWLGGGPSHLDMYDLKPAAPAQVRGPFRPVVTNVPGTHIGELLPRQARLMDRLAVVRSLHHGTNEHPAGMHWTQTGYYAPLTDRSAEPTHPSAGSITARLRGANRPGMVPYVHIAPDPLGIPLFIRIHEGAYLGPRYAPLRVETARAQASPFTQELDALISKVEFRPPCLEPLPGVDVDRIADRARLSRRIDRLARWLDGREAPALLDRYERDALEVLRGGAARAAFDLGREDPRVRERYGLNAWGQGLLLCRRLVEAGVTFVTLNTDSFSNQWDSHADVRGRLAQNLPVYDQMLTALLEDLAARGLTERVLVLVWGEFGRTPLVNSAGGRDHWGAAGFALLAGGGLRTGQVVGSTNAHGEHPKDRPVSPGDVLATVYHVLGIDPATKFPDRAGRLVPVLADAAPIRELI